MYAMKTNVTATLKLGVPSENMITAKMAIDRHMLLMLISYSHAANVSQAGRQAGVVIVFIAANRDTFA